MVSALRDGNTVGSYEIPAILKVLFNTEAAFVYQRVMLRAERHQVIEACITTVGPVFDMVAVQVAAIITARESATVVVPRTQRPLDCRGYNACLAPDAQWFTVVILGDDHSLTVTAKSLH